MNEKSERYVPAKFRSQNFPNDYSAVLLGNIQRAASGYFDRDRKKVVEVKIGRVEEETIYGFLKVSSEEKQENFLLDFQATSNSFGTILSLEVDGEDMKRYLHREDFNSLKEIIASALIGSKSAQETLKRKIAAQEIAIEELKPELVKSAIGYALGRLNSIRNREED